ncbi:MAG: hypothetical protein K6T59_06820 [Bryobacteraceae bacterium]|jgi:uncharacterized protein (TIGR03437 family)|nr:hypothetical protein [Bryobacteraceae bacterium]
MKDPCLRFVWLCTLAVIGGAQDCPVPQQTMTVSNVLNAATFRPGISSNAIFSIFGSGFASRGFSRAVKEADLVNGRFPTVFSCIAVELDGERVPILAVTDVQINAQAPSRPLPDPARVTVIRNPGRPEEIRVSWEPVRTRPYAPGFFTFDGVSIAALGVQYDLISHPNRPPYGRYARPGEIVLLFANGFGPTQPSWQSGEITDQISWLRDPVTVRIGNMTLRPEDVRYAGLAWGAISGLYQFNVRIPEETPNGDIPVTIEIGGFSTQPEAVLPVMRN